METQSLKNKDIEKQLIKMQSDISFIKEHIEDMTLTDDDLISIEEAEDDLKNRRTTSLKNLKKELGL